MIVSPYKARAPRHSVGFVMPNGKAVLEDGSVKRIRDLPPNNFSNQVPGLRLFADHHTIVSRFAMRGQGDLGMYHRKWFVWWPDDQHRVILLKDEPGNDPGVLEGLVGFRDFLASHGASIGSVGASTRSLLRTTLSEPLRTGVGVYGPKAITWENMGGRQESYLPAGHYPSFRHLDLRAAYARTMGDLFYDPAGEWFESSKRTIPDTPSPVFVRAKVRYPSDFELPGPLGRRRRRESDEYDEPREWPVSGEITGTYEAREIACAIEVGCDVKIERVWVRQYMKERDAYHPFRRWWHLIEKARELPGYAGDLGKLAGAALWGIFLGDDDTFRIHYEEAKIERWRKIRTKWSDRRHVGYDLAEIVTALVRARLYRELVVPGFRAGRLIGVHTDGGLVIDHPPMPRFGRDWVTKYRGRLQYITPNAFRFMEPGSKGWEYVLAGVEDRNQPHSFSELWLATKGKTAQGHFHMIEITEDVRFEQLRRALA